MFNRLCANITPQNNEKIMLHDILVFRCNVAGFDTCIRGECQTDNMTLRQYCECYPGFGPDLFTYHNHNCVVPNYAYETFFVLFTILWFGVLVVFVQRRANNRNKTLNHIGQLTLMFHITMETILVGYIVQGGMYEIAATGTFVFFTLLGRIISEMLALVVNMSHQKRNVIEFQAEVYSVMKIANVVYLVLGICNVGMIRSEYADVFTSISSITFATVLSKLMYLGRVHANEFITTVEVGILFYEGSSSENLKRLKTRAVRIQNYLGVHVWSANLAMVTPSSIRFVLGSVPFYYVMLFPSIACGNLMTLAVAELFEGEALDLKVSTHDKYIDFANDEQGQSSASGNEPSSMCSSTDTRHSGYIVGKYKVNTSRRKRRAKGGRKN